MTESKQISKKQRVHRYLSDDFTVRIAAVDATLVVQEAQALQKTFPLASVALGRSMVGSLLLASQLKDGQQVGLLFKGDGPLGSVYAEADFNGHVRGYSPRPAYEPESYENGLSLKAAMGQGTLTVARHQPFQKQPFHGTVEMVSGEIGDDIAHYLHQSHQIRSLVSLGVYLDEYGKVQSAGGVIIEIMPGVDEDVVNRIQQNADTKKVNISLLLRDGASPRDLVEPFMEGVPFSEIDHPHEISYFCPCTKERVTRALETLGEAELQDMIDKKENVEVTCQVCGRPYEVSIPELQEVKDKLQKEYLN